MIYYAMCISNLLRPQIRVCVPRRAGRCHEPLQPFCEPNRRVPKHDWERQEIRWLRRLLRRVAPQWQPAILVGLLRPPRLVVRMRPFVWEHPPRELQRDATRPRKRHFEAGRVPRHPCGRDGGELPEDPTPLLFRVHEAAWGIVWTAVSCHEARKFYTQRCEGAVAGCVECIAETSVLGQSHAKVVSGANRIRAQAFRWTTWIWKHLKMWVIDWVKSSRCWDIPFSVYRICSATPTLSFWFIHHWFNSIWWWNQNIDTSDWNCNAIFGRH